MDILFNHIGLIFILFFVTLGGVRLWAFFQRKNNLRKMAEQLGLHFSTRPLDKQAESELEGMKDRAWVAWFLKLMHLFDPWEINGKYQGMPVRMWTRYRESRRSRRSMEQVKGKEAFMRIEICFPENLDLGLQIFSENPFVKEGYDAYDDRRKGLQSGNKKLDEEVTINGISEERIIRLLRRTDILEPLLHLFGKYSNAVVDDESVRLEERRFILDDATCRARLKDLFEVASSIDRAIPFV
jgi:hypothetical protein